MLLKYSIKITYENKDKKKDIGETLTQVLRKLRKNQKEKLLKWAILIVSKVKEEKFNDL